MINQLLFFLILISNTCFCQDGELFNILDLDSTHKVKLIELEKFKIKHSNPLVNFENELDLFGKEGILIARNGLDSFYFSCSKSYSDTLLTQSYFYDSKNRIEKIIKNEFSIKRKMISEFYNSKNKSVRVDSFFNSNGLISYFTLNIDSSKLKFSSFETFANSKIDNHYRGELDSNFNIKYKERIKSEDWKVVFECRYDYLSRIILEEKGGRRSVYRYFDNISIIETSSGKARKRRVEIKNDGLISKVILFENKFNIVLDYNYEYDKKGNWVLRNKYILTEEGNRILKEVIKRNILYY